MTSPSSSRSGSTPDAHAQDRRCALANSFLGRTRGGWGAKGDNMKKIIVGVAIVATGVLGSAGSAWADHEHFVVREDRDGDTHCRYVAHGQTSKTADEGGGHKFHDNVHKGQPGSDDHGTSFDKESEEGVRCDHVNENGNR